MPESTVKFTVNPGLKPKNAAEKRIFDYLVANASDMLAYKIDHGDKTLAGAMTYAKNEAKKLAKQESSIMVEDETVFGWVIHFFEEDSEKEPKSASRTRLPGKLKVVKKEPEKAKAPTGPVVLDLFGADISEDPF